MHSRYTESSMWRLAANSIAPCRCRLWFIYIHTCGSGVSETRSQFRVAVSVAIKEATYNTSLRMRRHESSRPLTRNNGRRLSLFLTSDVDNSVDVIGRHNRHTTMVTCVTPLTCDQRPYHVCDVLRPLALSLVGNLTNGSRMFTVVVLESQN